MNFIVSIIIGSLVFAFGGLWYSPFLFGSYWIKANSIEMNASEETGLWKNYVAGLLNNIVMATGFNFLFYHFKIASLFDSLILGLVLWLAFVTPMLFSRVLWEQRSLGAHILDKFYYLFVILMISILTIAWM